MNSKAYPPAYSLPDVADRPMSRIENSMHDLIQMIDLVNSLHGRIIRHAVAFGYFTPDPPSPVTEPDKNPTNLREAMEKLKRHIAMLDGALNLFD